MKGDPQAPTREAYLASLAPERRTEIERLDALIRATAPELAPGYAPGFLGYGPYRYRYASGREGDTFVLSLASQKAYLALYVSAADAEGYLAERYRDRLPKASIGKSCVRFKSLDELDPEALRVLIREAATKPMAAKD